MSFLHGTILDGFASSVDLQLQIVKWLPELDLLKLQIVEFGKKRL